MIKCFDDFMKRTEVNIMTDVCKYSSYKMNHIVTDFSKEESSRMVAYYPEDDVQKFPLTPYIQKFCREETNKDVGIITVYSNLYWHSTPTSIHIDDYDPDTYTWIYFSNYEWKPNYGGELLFYNENYSEVIDSYTFKPGRLVMFDSRIPHCAKSPSVNSPEPRMTIAYKTKLVPIL